MGAKFLIFVFFGLFTVIALAMQAGLEAGIRQFRNVIDITVKCPYGRAVECKRINDAVMRAARAEFELMKQESIDASIH